MHVKDLPIGRVSGAYAGYRRSADLVISVSLEVRRGAFKTTDHREISQLTELSISGGVWNRAHTDFIECGQIRDALDNMVSYAPGWSPPKIMRLRAIWDEWHLNGLNASCSHQTAGNNSEPCPVTGYKWGSAWLSRELPASIITELTEMFQEA